MNHAEQIIKTTIPEELLEKKLYAKAQLILDLSKENFDVEEVYNYLKTINKNVDPDLARFLNEFIPILSDKVFSQRTFKIYPTLKQRIEAYKCLESGSGQRMNVFREELTTLQDNISDFRSKYFLLESLSKDRKALNNLITNKIAETIADMYKELQKDIDIEIGDIRKSVSESNELTEIMDLLNAQITHEQKPPSRSTKKRLSEFLKLEEQFQNSRQLFNLLLNPS
jgi:hypothetical protein